MSAYERQSKYGIFSVEDKNTGKTYLQFPGFQSEVSCPHILSDKEARQVISQVCKLYPGFSECIINGPASRVKPRSPLLIPDEQGSIVGIVSPQGVVESLPRSIPPPPALPPSSVLKFVSKNDRTQLLNDLKRGFQLKNIGDRVVPVKVEKATVPEINAVLEELKNAAKKPNLRPAAMREICPVDYIWNQALGKCMALPPKPVVNQEAYNRDQLMKDLQAQIAKKAPVFQSPSLDEDDDWE